MRNLSAEMARFGVTIPAMQGVLDCSEKTVRNKINGATEFSISEALKIRNAFFPGLQVEYLFADDAPGLEERAS